MRKQTESRKLKLKWNELSKQLRLKYPTCEYCEKVPSTQVHHCACSKFMYKSKYRFDEHNLICLCGKCHFLFHKSPAITMNWFWNNRNISWEYMINKIKQEK
jgi:hypothetical protein